ncbi:copper chaperone PCu(A)C [Kribbia dieselivorans]|uniref:copper chaperone PCu(A)C n=1 Tax=Kribbia dieselivorans TaxID=331526 RepID=UPI000838B61F|nr:copper chaperone PCu(A)C [Kribbia dieselivorans]
MRSRLASVSALAALTLAVSGISACGTSTNPADTPAGATTSTTPATAALAIKDGWVKATTETMTGVFGTLENSSDAPITITGGSSTAASKVETHITVKENGAMVMKRTDKGFTIEPGGTFELKPGANHIMLMGLKQEIKAGDPLTVSVKDADGTTYDLTVPGREFTGAEETYAPEAEDMHSTGSSDHSSMNHS